MAIKEISQLNASFAQYGFAHNAYVQESDIILELKRAIRPDSKFATNATTNF